MALRRTIGRESVLSLSATDVTKCFGAFTALAGVSLEAREGEFLALLGPSGSGKTTLLRVLAGLEFPDSGRVAIAGEDMSGTGARDRRVGFVFQHYALFRHMSVAENIGFGLSVRPRASRPPAAGCGTRRWPARRPWPRAVPARSRRAALGLHLFSQYDRPHATQWPARNAIARSSPALFRAGEAGRVLIEMP
jgi:ABC-type sugar transport system ATPase subunit